MYLKEGLTDDDRKIGVYKIIGKKNGDASIDDFYNYYKDIKVSFKKIPKKDANKLFQEFNKEISKKIVYTNLHFKMPAGLGVLSVRKRKKSLKEHVKNRRRVDYNETKKLWATDPEAKKARKLIYKYFESNDDDTFYRWKWDKYGYIIKNKSVYKFKPSRHNKKMISVALSSDVYKVDYFK